MKIWKRVAALIALAALLAAPARAEIDLSGLSLAELVELKQQITIAMWETEEWQEVEVPVGMYEIGVDIPAGYWTITAVYNDSSALTWGYQVEEGRAHIARDSQIEYALITAKTSPSWPINQIESVSWELINGTFLRVGGAPVIFTPFTGHDLGFK